MNRLVIYVRNRRAVGHAIVRTLDQLGSVGVSGN